jgi:mannose-6-phosphate isomerase-like protein (cupin superfamily)
MSHTIKNLREVDDMAPKFGFDAVQEARFCWRDLDAEQTGLALMKVKPGQRQAFAHRHDEAEEIYVVVGGSGRIKLDDEIVDLAPMDAIRIAPGVARALEGGPEGIEYIAFGPHHEGDGEILKEEGFWG